MELTDSELSNPKNQYLVRLNLLSVHFIRFRQVASAQRRSPWLTSYSTPHWNLNRATMNVPVLPMGYIRIDGLPATR